LDPNGTEVKWVEPYLFVSTGTMGTTASFPIFDKDVDPPFLVGVVWLDISIAQMEKIEPDFNLTLNK